MSDTSTVPAGTLSAPRAPLCEEFVIGKRSGFSVAALMPHPAPEGAAVMPVSGGLIREALDVPEELRSYELPEGHGALRVCVTTVPSILDRNGLEAEYGNVLWSRPEHLFGFLERLHTSCARLVKMRPHGNWLRQYLVLPSGGRYVADVELDVSRGHRLQFTGFGVGVVHDRAALLAHPMP